MVPYRGSMKVGCGDKKYRRYPLKHRTKQTGLPSTKISGRSLQRSGGTFSFENTVEGSRCRICPLVEEYLGEGRGKFGSEVYKRCL